MGLLRAGRGARPARRLRAVALSRVADRHRAARDSRERAARAVHRLRDAALQADRLRGVGDAHRLRRRAVRVPSSLRLGRSDVDLVLRRAARDGDHRRHAKPARSGARARCSTSCFANTCRSGRRTGCCSSGCCSSASSCSRRPAWSACGGGSPSRCAAQSSRPRRWRGARSSMGCRCRRSCAATRAGAGTVLEAHGLAKAFGGIHAVEDASLAVRRPHAARADRPQRRRQDDAVQSDLRACSRPIAAACVLDGRDITGEPPHRIVAAGLARSFQITNLFPALSVEENLRLAVQARDRSPFRRLDARDGDRAGAGSAPRS